MLGRNSVGCFKLSIPNMDADDIRYEGKLTEKYTYLINNFWFVMCIDQFCNNVSLPGEACEAVLKHLRIRLFVVLFSFFEILKVTMVWDM